MNPHFTLAIKTFAIVVTLPLCQGNPRYVNSRGYLPGSRQLLSTYSVSPRCAKTPYVLEEVVPKNFANLKRTPISLPRTYQLPYKRSIQAVPFTDMKQLGPITRPVLGAQKFIEMPYQNVAKQAAIVPKLPVAAKAVPIATKPVPIATKPVPELSCPGCSSSLPLVNPFLPAASPVSAMSPPTSSLLPPVNPSQNKNQFLRKIPIPPPTI